MWNGTIFVDLDCPLNASSLLSASAELLVATATCPLIGGICPSVRPFVTAGIVSK